MIRDEQDIQIMVSLPSASAKAARLLKIASHKDIFVASDPEGIQLGSGGGTAYILHLAFQASGASSWQTWLTQGRKMLIHGSGESRRLPAYAALGKPLTPMPLIEGFTGQKPGQTLLDFQMSAYGRFFLHAPSPYCVMIACGDVLVENDSWLPAYPNADVLIVGLSASGDEAQKHGVLVCESESVHLTNFLQKPSRSQLAALPEASSFYLDSGIWLLTEKAVMTLLKKCGWDVDGNHFTKGHPERYDLYGQFGLALGKQPTCPDDSVSALRAASLPLRQGRFYHFGTNRSLLGSVQQLSRPARGQTAFGDSAMQPEGRPVILNSIVECALSPDNRFIWIENAHLCKRWTLHQRHMLTGIPENTWVLNLPTGTCLDVVPLSDGTCCLRPYGFDDMFRGTLNADETTWMGVAFMKWLSARGLTPASAGLDTTTDIQEAPLFPVVAGHALDDVGGLLQWMIALAPETDLQHVETWLSMPRKSNRMLLAQADVARMSSQRMKRLTESPDVRETAIYQNWRMLDLQAMAELAPTQVETTEAETPIDVASLSGLGRVHHCMYLSALATRHKNTALACTHERHAFEALRELIIGQAVLDPVAPTRNALDDQIVWARSPIRIDLAGGWSDTPPYCLEHGGRVVNLAANLNGQPPIQVFARICKQPHIVIRSIDLGLDETITDFATMSDFGELGGGFSIARAALCLAGFDPRFSACENYSSLPDMLNHCMGGGIELSLLAAVPKGSGLGTSSILAATVLGAVSELCGLGWNKKAISNRTLVLEQLLTSGGGWQDQIGGTEGGLKLIETEPGLQQKATVRGLPHDFFAGQYINRSVLLYYTGITRVAHGILGEIVRGIFLNSARHLALIREISYNADFAADAIQRHDWGGFCEAISRSWSLNRLLDA
ncbi:MAG: bifunctional fucokinase/fucose-1-phosphate guanylyltransferase, partial [Verrucomicrobia bacterium]|nr:bifunctional fucokinase/fucose-1-phosphate guanylyltransferase [Verrucomicrobiota bacterium]